MRRKKALEAVTESAHWGSDIPPDSVPRIIRCSCHPPPNYQGFPVLTTTYDAHSPFFSVPHLDISLSGFLVHQLFVSRIQRFGLHHRKTSMTRVANYSMTAAPWGSSMSNGTGAVHGQ